MNLNLVFSKKLPQIFFSFLFFFSVHGAMAQPCPALSATLPVIIECTTCEGNPCDFTITICWDINQAQNSSFVYSVDTYLQDVIVTNLTASGCSESTFKAPCNSTNFTVNWAGKTNPNGGGHTCASGTILPVTLESFYPVKKDGFVELFWSTSSETNNEGFHVEKSTDGQSFEKFGFVNGEGNSSGHVQYYYSDRHPAPGMNYYRLKQIDFNGAFEYSPIISVNYENGRKIAINYYSGGQFVQIQKDVFIAKVEIFSISGGKMMDVVQKDLNDNRVDVSSLNTGMYVVVAQGANGEKVTYKFSKF